MLGGSIPQDLLPMDHGTPVTTQPRRGRMSPQLRDSHQRAPVRGRDCASPRLLQVLPGEGRHRMRDRSGDVGLIRVR